VADVDVDQGKELTHDLRITATIGMAVFFRDATGLASAARTRT
jgi:hypothetical protein